MTPSVEQTRSIRHILRTLGGADRDARARRKSARRAVNVRVLLDGKKSSEAWALNLSAGGIRVMGEETLAVGDMLRVRIDGDGEGVELAGVGRVVWVIKCSDGFVSGIEFVEPM